MSGFKRLIHEIHRRSLWQLLAIYLVGAAGTRLVSTALYGVDGLDPAVFVGATVVLGTVALLACVLSALHAARVDPVKALRAE